MSQHIKYTDTLLYMYHTHIPRKQQQQQQQQQILTFLVCEHLIVKEVSLNGPALQFVNAAVDELAEVLEVEQLSQELLHVGPGLQEAVGGGR